MALGSQKVKSKVELELMKQKNCQFEVKMGAGAGWGELFGALNPKHKYTNIKAGACWVWSGKVFEASTEKCLRPQLKGCCCCSQQPVSHCCTADHPPPVAFSFSYRNTNMKRDEIQSKAQIQIQPASRFCIADSPPPVAVPYILKANKLAVMYFWAQKNWQKKCVNRGDKISRQMCVYHDNIINLVTK